MYFLFEHCINILITLLMRTLVTRLEVGDYFSNMSYSFSELSYFCLQMAVGWLFIHMRYSWAKNTLETIFPKGGLSYGDEKPCLTLSLEALSRFACLVVRFLFHGILFWRGDFQEMLKSSLPAVQPLGLVLCKSLGVWFYSASKFWESLDQFDDVQRAE